MSITAASKAGKEAPPESATRAESAVVVRVRDMVMRGEFAAGFHVQEIPLAERLGVSRTPIREALNILAKEGLLEPGPKRGFKVRTFSVDEIVQAYEVRACLEGMACRLLAERGLSPELEQQLGKCLRVGDELLERGMFGAQEQQPWLEMNNEIHSLLVHATGNAMLGQCIDQTLRVPLASARHVHWYRFDKQNYERAKSAHRDHHKIIEAIGHRQAGRAEALMREHIHFSEALVREHFVNQRVGFDTVLPLETP
jgi:GntR family transcriptional regulator of vanillate catabolism